MKLYDACAFFEKFISGEIDADAFILDLTKYELGHTIYKHVNKYKDLDVEGASHAFNVINEWTNIILVDRLEIQEIFELSLKLKLTYYDSSYIHAAKKFNFILETFDADLYKKGKDICEIEFHKY